MASPEGTILNKLDIGAKGFSAVVKAAITVIPGLCYIDGANGVKNAPVDGSRDADELFWIEKSAGSATETKDKKVTIYPIAGLIVIGQAEGAIVVNVECKPATTASHGGWFITHVIRTDTVANHNTDNKIFCATYRGHEAEWKEGKTLTDAADLETNCVFELRGGS